MSLCTRCGRNLPGDSAFCDGCGSPVGLDGSTWTSGAVAGTAPECDIRLSNPVISSRHALFEVLPDGMIRVTDLGSTNGTWVNGTRIHSAVVGRGDQVSLASQTIDLAAVAAVCVRKEGGAQQRRGFAPVDPQVQRRQPPPEARPSPPPVRPPADRPSPAPAPPRASPDSSQRLEPRGSNRGPLPGKVRHPLLVLVLAVVTFGLYMLYWFWMTLDEIRTWRQGQGWGGAMVLLLFVPVFNLIFLVVYFLIPSYIWDLYARNGLQSPVSGPFGLVVFLPGLLVPLALVVMILNGAILNPVAWVVLAVIPAACALIWFVRVQTALNDFWRMHGAEP